MSAETVLLHVVAAETELARAKAELAGLIDTPPPEPVDPPAPSGWVDFPIPPRVEVPRLEDGTRPRVPVPGTGLEVVFTQPVASKRNGASMQCTYEHATRDARQTDPLVTPGNGSHPHHYWGSALGDVEDLERLWARTPEFEIGSQMDRKGGPKTWEVDPVTNRAVGHQPGIWHPAMFARLDGGWVKCRMGSGSALNYVRDNAAHDLGERLLIPPNGVGYVAFGARPHWEQVSAGWRLRVPMDGPTWTTGSVPVGPWASPTEFADFWAFGRPDWAGAGDARPVPEVQVYIKSPDLTFPAKIATPALSWGMPGSDIEPHFDYVAGSTPMAVHNGRIVGPAPDGDGDTILFGQWIADMTINRHLFHTDLQPAYGRWELRVAGS